MHLGTAFHVARLHVVSFLMNCPGCYGVLYQASVTVEFFFLIMPAPRLLQLQFSTRSIAASRFACCESDSRLLSFVVIRMCTDHLLIAVSKFASCKGDDGPLTDCCFQGLWVARVMTLLLSFPCYKDVH